MIYREQCVFAPPDTGFILLRRGHGWKNSKHATGCSSERVSVSDGPQWDRTNLHECCVVQVWQGRGSVTLGGYGTVKVARKVKEIIKMRFKNRSMVPITCSIR